MKNKLSKKTTDYLSKVYDYVIRPLTLYHRGMIVADDDSGEVLDSVDRILHFEIMKQDGKYHEITIDNNWPFDNVEALENILIDAARKANNGLLRINATELRLFEACPCNLIKELAKQERIRFDIYVLLVIKGISWKEVEDYASKHSEGQFEDMMRQWYQRIK